MSRLKFVPKTLTSSPSYCPCLLKDDRRPENGSIHALGVAAYFRRGHESGTLAEHQFSRYECTSEAFLALIKRDHDIMSKKIGDKVDLIDLEGQNAMQSSRELRCHLSPPTESTPTRALQPNSTEHGIVLMDLN